MRGTDFVQSRANPGPCFCPSRRRRRPFSREDGELIPPRRVPRRGLQLIGFKHDNPALGRLRWLLPPLRHLPASGRGIKKVRMIVPLGLIAASLAAPASAAAAASLHDGFNPQQAYAYTARIAGFGERWPGSPGHKKTEDLIHQVLQKDGARVDAGDFTASTPRGPIAFHNIVGKFKATADPRQNIFILAGHYDTLFQPGFIGANDGASSTAILLAFADALAGPKTKMQIWLVWTDLEEAKIGRAHV